MAILSQSSRTAVVDTCSLIVMASKLDCLNCLMKNLREREGPVLGCLREHSSLSYSKLTTGEVWNVLAIRRSAV